MARTPVVVANVVARSEAEVLHDVIAKRNLKTERPYTAAALAVVDCATAPVSVRACNSVVATDSVEATSVLEAAVAVATS